VSDGAKPTLKFLASSELKLRAADLYAPHPPRGYDLKGGDVPTEAPTIPLANKNRPIGYSASPLLSIRKITLFGKWPTPLANGPLGQATGRPVGERSGFKNAPLQLVWQHA
jgi:hypothetical protein